MRDEISTPPEGFIGYGEDSYFEEFLTGNREGFVELKRLIDIALETNEPVEFEGVIDSPDFRALAVVDRPKASNADPSGPDYLVIGCLAAFSLIIILTGFGCWKVVELLMQIA